MRQFGIRVTLTDDNPLRADHLLGSDWAAWHWFDTESEREKALGDMERRLPNYRDGDDPGQITTRVERESEAH